MPSSLVGSFLLPNQSDVATHYLRYPSIQKYLIHKADYQKTELRAKNARTNERKPRKLENKYFSENNGENNRFR